jgi:predicted component of type VI protein secretion system
MGRMSVQDALAYFTNSGKYVGDNLAACRRAAAALKPPDFEGQIDEITRLVSEQVDAKLLKSPASAALAKALREAMTLSSGAADAARSYFKQTGQSQLLKTIPKQPKRQDMDSHIGYVGQVCAYIAKHPQVTVLDRAGLKRRYSELLALKAASSRALRASVPVTGDLERRLSKALDRTEDWVSFIKIVARLTGDQRLLSSAPRQAVRATGKRKPAGGQQTKA